MLIKEIFFTLNQMVAHIATRLPTNDKEEMKRLEQQVKELRKLSDTILNEWVNFEEGIVAKIGQYFPKLLTHSIIEESKQKVSNSESSNTLMEQIPLFYKAKGYFDLGIYQESYPLLKNIVNQEPDHEFARLYFAYSALFKQKQEEAIQHFSLLEKTSTNTKIRSVCLNALGILHFDEGSYDSADRYFQHAIAEDQGHFVAFYNLGLTHYTQGNYKDAILRWEEYLTLTQDTDLELIFFLSNAYFKLGQYQKAIQLWRIKSPHNQEHILYQLGHFFEDLHQYEEAILCYKNILLHDSNQAEAIHGLAWNQWLFTNDKEIVLPLLKKALSLSSKNLSIAFSLAWIYFHLELIEDSEKVVTWILKQDSEFALGISLSFLLSLKKKNWDKAEEWVNKLMEQKENQNRALGELFLGRLRLKQNKFDEAIHSFRRSVWSNPHLKESYLLQGLAYYLNHEVEKAKEIWKKHDFISTL